MSVYLKMAQYWFLQGCEETMWLVLFKEKFDNG